MRLEGVAPIGAPAFILVAESGHRDAADAAGRRSADRRASGHRPRSAGRRVAASGRSPGHPRRLHHARPEPTGGHRFAQGMVGVDLTTAAPLTCASGAASGRNHAGLLPLVAIEYGAAPRSPRRRGSASGRGPRRRRCQPAPVAVTDRDQRPDCREAFTVAVPVERGADHPVGPAAIGASRGAPVSREVHRRPLTEEPS